MKTYIGRRLLTGGTVVSVQEGETLAPLRHHPLHSPDGFEWGYGGSGPSDLALAILLDHYGVEVDELPVSYMDFKDEVVAEWPREDGWEFTSDEVAAWAESKLPGR